MPADERPFDYTPLHTEDLPNTPVRDRNIPAIAWQEAPEALLSAGEDLGNVKIAYKRRIDDWLLWRAGPAKGSDARYVAIRADDNGIICTFRLFPDGTGKGIGADNKEHLRFRTWKQSLQN